MKASDPISLVGTLSVGLAVSYGFGVGGPAQAAEVWTRACEPAVSVSATYKADVVSVLQGGLKDGTRFADNLDVIFDADLSRAIRWSGATAHVHILNNSGDAPNDLAGTLQGVDNIEVERQRVKIYELWLEQQFGDASVRLGLYDLNSEFYATDSAGLLIAPAFGIGSELAATGPNGPSIFPSTALGMRLDWRASEAVTLRAAVINARAGVIGDPESVDLAFEDGALFIAEAAWRGPLALSLGGWRYSEQQDDIRDLDGAGAPRKRAAQGAYMSAERRLSADDEGRTFTAFFRAGVSEGATTDYAGGWQSGLLIERALPGRPDSAFSIGAYEGVLSDRLRANQRDIGVATERAESSIEVTFSDRLHKNLSVQPDLQFFPHPAGESGRDALWVANIRFTVELN